MRWRVLNTVFAVAVLVGAPLLGGADRAYAGSMVVEKSASPAVDVDVATQNSLYVCAVGNDPWVPATNQSAAQGTAGQLPPVPLNDVAVKLSSNEQPSPSDVGVEVETVVSANVDAETTALGLACLLCAAREQGDFGFYASAFRARYAGDGPNQNDGRSVNSKTAPDAGLIASQDNPRLKFTRLLFIDSGLRAPNTFQPVPFHPPRHAS